RAGQAGGLPREPRCGPSGSAAGLRRARPGDQGGPRMEARSGRMAAVLAAIDAANADDPRTIASGGAPKAYEIVYSERMAARLAAMYPDASELLRIAAHAQHIRRWDIPRADFPGGRDGYN